MVKKCWLRLVIFLGLALLMPPQHAMAQSFDDTREMLAKRCKKNEKSDEARTACTEYYFDLLDEYIKLRDSYPKDSKQYQTLVSCSKEWPQDVIMWRMCASRTMPEEQAFKYAALSAPAWSRGTTTPGTTDSTEPPLPEDIQKLIIRRCQQTEPTKEARAACRKYMVERLREYVVLLNSYPQDSQQYKTLVACSKEWPEDLMMWKVCASRAMPEEQAFKPFSLVAPDEPYYQFRIDPRDTVMDSTGKVPLMPFTVKSIYGPTASSPTGVTTSPMFGTDGVYIPGGTPQ